jgi:hypothetical protein
MATPCQKPMDTTELLRLTANKKEKEAAERKGNSFREGQKGI